MDIHKVLRKLASYMNGLHKANFHTNMWLEAQLAKQVELEVKLEALFILANLMDENGWDSEVVR